MPAAASVVRPGRADRECDDQHVVTFGLCGDEVELQHILGPFADPAGRRVGVEGHHEAVAEVHLTLRGLCRVVAVRGEFGGVVRRAGVEGVVLDLGGRHGRAAREPERASGHEDRGGGEGDGGGEEGEGGRTHVISFCPPNHSAGLVGGG